MRQKLSRWIASCATASSHVVVVPSAHSCCRFGLKTLKCDSILQDVKGSGPNTGWKASLWSCTPETTALVIHCIAWFRLRNRWQLSRTFASALWAAVRHGRDVEGRLRTCFSCLTNL